MRTVWGVPPENCSVRGASSLVRSPLPCCCSRAMPCTWAVLPTLVGRLPKNGGHHQAVCRLGPTPFLSLGAWGACPVHGVPRCPQVAGLQITRATSLLPGYGSPSAGGKPTGLVSPQGQPTGDPTAPRSQAVNSGLPYLEGEPTGLVSPPGWPWAPHGTSFPSLPGLCPETEDPGQNQPPSHGVSGELRPAREQSQPAGHGWQSFHDVAPGMGRREPAGSTLWPPPGGLWKGH